MFLAVILRDYCVICPPGNPQCTTVRLRLTGVLSLVLAQNSALKWNLSFKSGNNSLERCAGCLS